MGTNKDKNHQVINLCLPFFSGAPTVSDESNVCPSASSTTSHICTFAVSSDCLNVQAMVADWSSGVGWYCKKGFRVRTKTARIAYQIEFTTILTVIEYDCALTVGINVKPCKRRHRLVFPVPLAPLITTFMLSNVLIRPCWERVAPSPFAPIICPTEEGGAPGRALITCALLESFPIVWYY